TRIQGWTFYLTTPEVAFEVGVRLIFTALAAILLATICTAIVLPFVKLSPARVVEWVTRAAAVLVLFLDSRLALTMLIEGRGRGPRFILAAMTAHIVAFVVALAIPRLRKELLGSLDIFLGPRVTRAIALGTVAATVVLAVTEFAIARATRTVRAANVAHRPKS